jgi:hypothetical protein
MLDIAHKTSGWALVANTVWVWVGDNANSITATCALLGLAVNAWCSIAKYMRNRK